MIEKIKAVNNPLTIMAIFCALAEIAGTVALATVDKSLQSTFVWFVMLFPAVLLILFFFTLNVNPKVLYAPSDFKKEENFLTTISGTNDLSIGFKDLKEYVESTKTEMRKAIGQVSTSGEKQRNRLTKIVDEYLAQIQNKVIVTQETAEKITLLFQRQVRQLEISTRGDTYGDLYTHQHLITQFFIDNLEFIPFFYEGIVPDEKIGNTKKIKAVAEMVADFFEHVYLQLPSLGDDTREGWESYIRHIYQNSPAIKEHLDKNQSWYSRKLINLLYAESNTKQDQ